MGILQAITNFFESLFMGQFPEVKKKQSLQKIDAELKKIQPVIYKSGMLQPNFPELFRILYENTKIVGDILLQTICSKDIKIKGFYERQLLITGFTSENQEKLSLLTYENRKSEVSKSNSSTNRIIENQRHILENLAKELNTAQFIQIDEVIAQLQQLNDICQFNYLSIIHNFDPEYNGFNISERPNFVSSVSQPILGSLQDFYYISCRFKVSSALARAVLALAQIQNGRELSDEKRNQLLESLKKINSVLSKYLTGDILHKIICLGKKEPDLVFKTASYQVNVRQKFVQHIQEKFDSDSARIKNEIKDNVISIELKKLFDHSQLLELNGYNQDCNKKIQGNCPSSFNYIMPLQIIKTFIYDYFDDDIKALLNDVVIEGIFNNQSYKTEFSSEVYACVEIPEMISDFEKAFARGEKFDQAVLEGYIEDSHKDSDFVRKMIQLVDNINEEAHTIVQNICSNIFKLYRQIEELLIDAKKTQPDTVSNIKVLFASSRNKDRARKLELQFEKWTNFLEIMKNYAIVGEVKR